MTVVGGAGAPSGAGSAGTGVDSPPGTVGSPPARADHDRTGSRHERQVTFAGIGRAGQERLASSCVAIVGCGAVGSAAAQLLARAGVGRLRLIDRDVVEWTNLHRQVLFDEAQARAGMPKAIAAAEALRRAAGDVVTEPVVADVCAWNVQPLLFGADVVVDGTDNFEARFLINDACVRHGTPWVYCAAVAAEAVTMTIRPGTSACLSCLYPEVPTGGTADTCVTAGVIGPAPAAAGAIAASEALKILVGGGETNPGLMVVDLWHADVRVLAVERRPDCPTCGLHQFRHLAAEATPATELCGSDGVQIRPRRPVSIDLASLAQRLAPVGEVHPGPEILRLRAEGCDLLLFADGRAIVRGASGPEAARRLYARYVGM